MELSIMVLRFLRRMIIARAHCGLDVIRIVFPHMHYFAFINTLCCFIAVLYFKPLTTLCIQISQPE